MTSSPPTGTDEQRAAPRIRHGQRDHMVIGRTEIAAPQMIKVFAAKFGVARG